MLFCIPKLYVAYLNDIVTYLVCWISKCYVGYLNAYC